MSVVAIVAGSFLALARNDIKKMLTYLIIAEVGYMVGGDKDVFTVHAISDHAAKGLVSSMAQRVEGNVLPLGDRKSVV